MDENEILNLLSDIIENLDVLNMSICLEELDYLPEIISDKFYDAYVSLITAKRKLIEVTK